MVYNGYYKVMSNIPKMGQLPTPGQDHIQWETCGTGHESSHHPGPGFAPGEIWASTESTVWDLCHTSNSEQT